MRRTALKLAGIFALLAGMASMAPAAKAQVCNLFCIQGYHCKIVHGEPTCVPDHP